MRKVPTRRAVAALLASLAVTSIAVVVNGASADPAPRVPSRAPQRPNIVLVLMDDFSMDLLQTMRSARTMQDRGASYRHSYVVDSLCCVSRTSLLTGQYPHQTGVLTNTANLPNRHGPIGGYRAFQAYGNGRRSFNVPLHEAGYTTGYVGKFLNEYATVAGDEGPESPGKPPGWDEWRAIFPEAYDGWGYPVVELDGSLRWHRIPDGDAPAKVKDRSYAGTVTADIALDFVRRHRNDAAPYFLQVSTYGPHSSVNSRAWAGEPLYAAAFGDRPSPRNPGGDCGAVACSELDRDDLPGLGDPRDDNAPVFEDGSPAPAWRTNRIRVTHQAAVDALRNRARMVQSIDRMLGRLLREIGPDTYVFLTSDNGFHLGQHQLEMAKGTPYDSDVRVPLLVTGPGVVPGQRDEMVSNIDLAATFEELAGLPTPVYRSGTSFADTLTDPSLRQHDYVFFEHTYAPSLGGDDPDRWYAGGTIDLIPSYVAVRDRHGLLVRVDLDDAWTGTRYAWEYYDYRDAPFERANTYRNPTHPEHLAGLRAKLAEFDACAGVTREQPVSEECRRITE